MQTINKMAKLGPINGVFLFPKHSETLEWNSKMPLKSKGSFFLKVLQFTSFMILVQHIVRKIKSIATKRPFFIKVKRIITHPLCGKIFKRMAPKIILALLPITAIIKKVYHTSITDTNSPRKKIKTFTTAFYNELKDLDPETRNEIIQALIPCPLIPIIEPCFESEDNPVVEEGAAELNNLDSEHVKCEEQDEMVYQASKEKEDETFEEFQLESFNNTNDCYTIRRYYTWTRRFYKKKKMNSRDENEKTVKVSLPDQVTTSVFVRDTMSVEEFLSSACARKNLNPSEHFVRVKKRRDMEDHNYFVPHRSDLIETYLHTHEVVEVCAKILYQVELSRSTLEQMWGFSVEAELVENADRQDELCCYVSRVEDKSVAMQNGIIKGDEIMVINGSIVSDLDMMYLESVLQEELSLCMMMRSSRTEPPDITGMLRATDDIIESLVCPPPPTEPPVISEEMISGLIVPAPGKDRYQTESTESQPGQSESSAKVSSRTNSFEIENLLKSAEQVTGFCRSPVEMRKTSNNSNPQTTVSTPNRQLSDSEKLRKVIMELVDTERTYVKHLNSLLENYLEPLKKETFLSNAEINALFGNIQEIVAFQRQFLRNLEEAIELEPDFHKFDYPHHFKNILFSIGSAFLYYVNHFKLYSSFCASHSKAQKVLHPNEGNQALQEFLISRNPKQQHSSTLESYLIKPIQRILKYPLLLQQLRNLTEPNTDEHQHLVEALKGMEKVAEHINEMQRIHEEYGAIFDHLFRQHQKSCKQSIDLSPGDLLYYGGVEWLNISDFLGKIKKGLELHAMCFVFKTAVVFLCKERLRQKKKIMGVASKAASSEVEIIRYQVLIPVTEVQVRASSAKDMDSHFLWELIHLRSQLQRRSEKIYVLSNSTGEFRNAFLKTIRQIIRESVRNMSIPSTKPGSGPGILLVTGHKGGSTDHHSNSHSHTLERPKHHVIIQGSQTLGKPKKTKNQRLSAGNIEYGNGEPEPEEPPGGFRSRSKTIGDAADAIHERMNHDRNDAGAKSEGEDDSQGTSKPKASLGKTPNHLTLSTTSTLSAGSTGSQARLIQSSHPPEKFHPVQLEELGSPIWKPREVESASSSLSRKTRSDLSSSRKSLTGTGYGGDAQDQQ